MSALPITEANPPLFGRDEIRELRDAAGPASEERVVRLSPAATAVEQKVLAVLFHAPDGRTWRAIGGGNSLAAAIAFARDSLPRGHTWHLVGWDDLYGDQPDSRTVRSRSGHDTAIAIIPSSDREPILKSQTREVSILVAREELTITEARPRA